MLVSAGVIRTLHVCAGLLGEVELGLPPVTQLAEAPRLLLRRRQVRLQLEHLPLQPLKPRLLGANHLLDFLQF